MLRLRPLLLLLLATCCFTVIGNELSGASSEDALNRVARLIDPGNYGDESNLSIWETLQNRARANPFHLVTFTIFLLAIIHTLMANKIQSIAHRYEHARKRDVPIKDWKNVSSILPEDLVKSSSVRVELLHFLGEVEVVFGLWAIPLLASIHLSENYKTAIAYLDSRNFTEPLFVIIVMVFASTRPIIQFAERALKFVAELGKGTASAWWLTILILGPLMGSFITEPGAMTISALLLSRQFFQYRPSITLRYVTLGLLFVNISVGGVLTHFAAPPVLMVAGPWGWDTPFMLQHFGWKAALGILINTSAYYFFFRQEFQEIDKKKAATEVGAQLPRAQVPFWITAVHLFLLAWTVIHVHHPYVMLTALFFFLGFYQATAAHQSPFSLRPALLVGFFLAALILHGGLQGWWLQPILSGLSETVLMGMAIILTAFNDNAAVTYLTTLVPNFADNLKYAVVAGAVTGGGLTVIANAPNPAGQSLLSHHFDNGISPLGLLKAAAPPTAIMALLFFFL